MITIFFMQGEGFILQRLQGDGMAFVHACGTIIRRELRAERIRMDTGCLVAYTEGISFDVMLVPGLKSMIFGELDSLFFCRPVYFGPTPKIKYCI
jgi:uncharacterized protein (AIM24 family)